MLRFHKTYFILSLFLLGTEILIAVYMHDRLIRPYGGDFLVVIWLYCLIGSFFNFPRIPMAIGVLIFAYLVETSQYFHLADRLGFDRPSVMRVILGSSFEWIDLLAYTLGIGLVLLVESKAVQNGRTPVYRRGRS